MKPKGVIKMTMENFIKELINQKGYTLKDFSKLIDIPLTTLHSALKEGKFGGTALRNVIKICKGLNIQIKDLEQCENYTQINISEEFTSFEKKIVYAYKEKDLGTQSAVLKLLDLNYSNLSDDMKSTTEKITVPTKQK